MFNIDEKKQSKKYFVFVAASALMLVYVVW